MKYNWIDNFLISGKSCIFGLNKKTFITILTYSKSIEIFCLVDDFCKFFEARMKEYTLHASGKRKYHRDGRMSKVKVIVVLFLFHCSSYHWSTFTWQEPLSPIPPKWHHTTAFIKRHRSFDNFVVNLLSGIAAYCCFPKKSCINLNREVDTQLAFCWF